MWIMIPVLIWSYAINGHSPVIDSSLQKQKINVVSIYKIEDMLRRASSDDFLIYFYLSLKTYFVGTHEQCFCEALLMRIRNRGLVKEEYLVIILGQSFLFTHKKNMLWVLIRSISAYP